MFDIKEKSKILESRLGLKYNMVGFMHADKKPQNALGFKSQGAGCVAPLIFSAAKGKIVAFDKDTTGYPCSTFYFGYSDWVFEGIEYFLSSGPVNGRECERFIKTAEKAKEFVKSFKQEEKTKGALVFKPINEFTENEKPEIIIIFANPDQMSALNQLIHFNHPMERDRVITGFASACMSFYTIPMQYIKKGEQKAFWGLHDISIRPAFPKDLTSMAMPIEMFLEILSIMEESFLFTEKWNKLLFRIKEGEN
jgi:hypothetical protein